MMRRMSFLLLLGFLFSCGCSKPQIQKIHTNGYVYLKLDSVGVEGNMKYHISSSYLMNVLGELVNEIAYPTLFSSIELLTANEIILPALVDFEVLQSLPEYGIWNMDTKVLQTENLYHRNFGREYFIIFYADFEGYTISKIPNRLKSKLRQYEFGEDCQLHNLYLKQPNLIFYKFNSSRALTKSEMINLKLSDRLSFKIPLKFCE